MGQLKINDGIILHYDEYGTGDKYVLCSQEMHFKKNTYQISLAKKGFHVFNITIRGYGESTHVFGEGYGNEWYNIWADDTVTFAKAMGIKKFIYTGHSHGAGIGWHICLRHPEMLEGFISIGGGPHKINGQTTDLVSEFSRGATIAAAKAGMDEYKKYIERAAEYYAVELKGDETPEEIRLIEDANQEWEDYFKSYTIEEALIDPKKPLNWCDSEEELIAELSKINVPVLHLAGIQDKIIRPEIVMRSAKAVKGSKAVFYEDCHHGVPELKLKDVVNEILIFCEDRKLFVK